MVNSYRYGRKLLYCATSLSLLGLTGCIGFDFSDAFAIGVFNFVAGSVTGTLGSLLPLTGIFTG